MKVGHHRRTWFLNCELVSNEPNLQKGFQNFNLRSQRFILKKFGIWIIFSLSKFDRISFLWRIVAHYGEVASSLCYIRKLPDGSTYCMFWMWPTDCLSSYFPRFFWTELHLSKSCLWYLSWLGMWNISHRYVICRLREKVKYTERTSSFEPQNHYHDKICLPASLSWNKHREEMRMVRCPTYSDGSWQYIL